MATTTKTPYGEELLDKGLSAVQAAQSLALGYIAKGVETLNEYAPQAQETLHKVDLVDAKHAVDSAFEVATRVLDQQRAFVGTILGTIFASHESPATKPVKPASEVA